MPCSCRIHSVPEPESSQPASVPAIALEDVRKRFGPQVGLDGLTLAVASGSVFGLLGPNGAGKTTTVRVLLGLVRPDAGSARVLGLDPTRGASAVRARVGVLLEEASLALRDNDLSKLRSCGGLLGWVVSPEWWKSTGHHHPA
jgi:ABC-2 type transport system ATP-binding protein